MEQKVSSFTETFFSKLKEQSFTILLLVVMMYYQNRVYTQQMEEYKTMIKSKEELILKLTEEERNRLIEREKYLVTQRDDFITELRREVQENNKK